MGVVIAPAREVFESWSDAWARINDRQGGSIVLAPWFVRVLLDSFAGDDVLLVADDDRDPSVVMLVERAGKGTWQTFQPSQAPLGLAVVDPSAPGAQRLGRILRGLPVPALGISVMQQDPERSGLGALADGGEVERRDYIETSVLDVSGDWETYWKARSKNLRHNLRRQRRRLDEAGTEPGLTEIRGPADVRAAVERYAALEQAGWKGESGSAVSFDNPQGEHYVATLEEACRRGAGVVAELTFDGVVVASDLCVHAADTLVILKTAYDESVSGYSLGLLLHQEIFRRCFDTWGIRRVEFYGRTLDWHRKWTPASKRMFHVSVYRGSALARLKSIAERIARTGERR